MRSSYQFFDEAAYPPIQVCCQNKQYAKAMLYNIGSCHSEMSAISLYFYNSIIAKECFPEIAECFHQISKVEMHHLNIFGNLASLLGADPRLWNYSKRQPVYWSPACNQYFREIGELIKNAVNSENRAIEQYQQQGEWIKDSNVVDHLNRIILDEKLHVKVFHQLYESVCS